MTLAAIDIGLLWVIGALVFALGKWIRDKASSAPPAPPAESSPQRQNPGASSEEERMRKFMEALGIPSESRDAPPPRERPASARPRRLGVPGERPIPPIVVPEGPFKRPRLSKAPAPPAPPPLPRKPSADEAPAPTLPVEQIMLAPLAVPQVPHYKTVSSTVSAMPGEHLRSVDLDPIPSAAQEEAIAAAETFRRMLSSPRDLRAAIALREVLGPPRSLQT